MTSEVVKIASHRLSLSIAEVHNVVTQYTNAFVLTLENLNNDDVTLSYIDMFEMSTGTVNLGLAYRQPWAKQVLDFSESLGQNPDYVRTVLTGYADAVTLVLATQGTLTLQNIGLLKISDQDTIRFWSSCAYNRRGTPIRSAVNPVFRQRFNRLLAVSKTPVEV